ncbi:MAG: hypothetical protein LBT74_12880 [Acidobacteriota bacterium]|nr:hypothetical protein [Acidobacteriota bacterium]
MSADIYEIAEETLTIHPKAERLLRDCADEESPGLARYAWLELEGGSWRFLTSPFADPGEARRRWKDEQAALRELEWEGWQVIHAFPAEPGMQPDSGIGGYGLRRTIN